MNAPLADGMHGVAGLNTRFAALDPQTLIAGLADIVFPGRVVALSSFGADSVVLLHLISEAAPHLPVLFLQTGKHFTDTLVYRQALVERLRLTGVIDLKPAATDLKREDPFGRLHESDPDACCRIRKVRPLNDALSSYDATITGRRRHQAQTRSTLKVFERDGARVRINPLAGWSQDDVDAYIEKHDLPRHPMVEDGFRSIGCAPCTTPTAPGEDPRAGRWRSSAKVECGIH